MANSEINKDHLLLLVKENGCVHFDKLNIEKHFKKEKEELDKICNSIKVDNIDELIKFIRASVQPKLSNRKLKYCLVLDKAYQRVKINVLEMILNIISERENINQKYRIFKKEEKELKLQQLKDDVLQELEDWFNAYDIEKAYEKAKKLPNVLVYSHRISGWSKPEYRITDNLKQEIKTNFGYGSASYFYSLFTFKDVQIAPFSNWVNYRYSNFSEGIRFTRCYHRKYDRTFNNNKYRYNKVDILNDDWEDALLFAKKAANLSIKDEEAFVEKYIIQECETMVDKLENIYNNDFSFIDDKKREEEGKREKRYRVDIKGFELIAIKTEKIIGALDFITQLMEYSSIILTDHYISRIKSLSKKFIPNVYPALEEEEKEFEYAETDLDNFLKEHNKILEKYEDFQGIMIKLKADFNSTHGEEYKEFLGKLTESRKNKKRLEAKVEMHENNIEKLNHYIDKYNKWM